MTKMGTAITLERSQYPDRSLHDRVVHAIGRKILGGELLPVALLPAEPDLGASRTVLREAVMRHLVQATAREVEAMSRRLRTRRQGASRRAR
jgi:hypothetical protein